MVETVEEKIRKNMIISGNALDYVREMEEESGGSSLVYWRKKYLEKALFENAEFMPAVSQIGKMWSEVYKRNQSLSPAFELEEIVRGSETWTDDDLVIFDEYLKKALRIDKKELLGEVAEILKDQLASSEDVFSRGWIKLLLESIKEVKKIKPGGILLAHPDDLELLQWFFSVLQRYYEVTWALNRMVKDKIVFLKKRYKAFMRIKGKLTGPSDMADTHSETDLE